MTAADWDLLVVGGGIHGVGVAQAATANGYRVALLEQTALAHGTSSRSSKLIHGGLRYLESGNLRLVRESLRERELLLQLAPDLVWRRPFFLPLYRDTSRAPWMLRTGLLLYAVLAGIRNQAWFRCVPQREWDQLDGLQTAGLRKIFQYWDAQTDDRRLTKAVMQSAERLGATLFCPARVTSITISADRCRVEFVDADGQQACTTQVVVNAAGPWANEILALCRPPRPPFPVELVQGTHLELPGKLLHGCYYLEVPADRRAVFVLPHGQRTLLGTTEQHYEGDPSQVVPLRHEKDYLLAAYRQFFPRRADHILDAWAGLRVLPAAPGAAFRRSRETQLPVDNSSQPRLLSIFGGKLTAYRATAERVVRKLRATLPPAKPIARTDELPLHGPSSVSPPFS